MKTKEKNEVLDFFDRNAERDRLLAQFNPSLWTTREQFAQRFNIGRTTVWRWEDSIIRLVFPLAQEYQGGLHHPFLDSYQRFILAIVFLLKNGLLVEGKYMTYDEIKDYLKNKQQNLTREKFTNWIQRSINVNSSAN
jgi:hypothetical protein